MLFKKKWGFELYSLRSALVSYIYIFKSFWTSNNFYLVHTYRQTLSSTDLVVVLGISSKALPTISQRRVVGSTVGWTAQLPVSTLVCHIISSTALCFNRALLRRNFRNIWLFILFYTLVKSSDKSFDPGNIRLLVGITCKCIGFGMLCLVLSAF